MVRTSRHLFAHMPKTGGTWLSSALRPHGRDRVGDGHGSLRSVHTEWVGARSFAGTVRNPWDWYVSWWQHCQTGGPTQIQRLKTMGGGSLGFRSVLYGATHPGRHTWKHPGLLWRVEYPDALPYLQGEAGGLWSWATRWFYGDGAGSWRADVLLDQACLHEGAEALTGFDLDAAPVNARVDRPGQSAMNYAALYDDEMRGWVLAADGPLLAELGYIAPHSPSIHGPVIRLQAA